MIKLRCIVMHLLHLLLLQTEAKVAAVKKVRSPTMTSLFKFEGFAVLNLQSSCTYLSQVCPLPGRCESCRPCSPGRQSGERACWGHPWGSSWPYRGDDGSSCGAESPGIRVAEPKTYGGTAKSEEEKNLILCIQEVSVIHTVPSTCEVNSPPKPAWTHLPR